MAKKVTALTKITAQAKKIRAAHPRMEWGTAISEASKQYNKGALGTAPKKSVGKKPAIGKKRAVGKKTVGKASRAIRYETMDNSRVSVVSYPRKTGGKTVVKTTSKRVSGVDKVLQINKEIDRLEALRKKQVGKQAKDGIQVFINAEHKKLKNLIASKRRSA